MTNVLAAVEVESTKVLFFGGMFLRIIVIFRNTLGYIQLCLSVRKHTPFMSNEARFFPRNSAEKWHRNKGA